MAFNFFALIVLLFSCAALSQKNLDKGLVQCSNGIKTKYAAKVAPGYEVSLLYSGLTNPRGMVFDSKGNLLVLENGVGVTALKLTDQGGTCLSVASKKNIIRDSQLKHALQLNADGTKIFTSRAEIVYSVDYNADTMTADTPNNFTWVTGMTPNKHHYTRTLLLSKKVPGMMLVSQGSTSNLDPDALTITTGRCNIRAFNIGGAKKTQKYTDGTVIGWGLRNSIGIDEDPITGGIWSNENGVDKLTRAGENEEKDIHENSPGEEVNFHGYLNGTKHPDQGRNYGYPYCAAAWDVANLPRRGKINVGTQFSYTTTSLGRASAAAQNDITCAANFVAPRITLPPHWAPIDLRFNSKGTVAYMTSHGSWNKDKLDGYQLFAVSFDGQGNPVHPSDSTSAHKPILENAALTGAGLFGSKFCTSCFRPTGLAFDTKGRLFMASDTTGEIYVINRADGSSMDSLVLEKPGKPEGLSAVRRDPSILNVRKESTWGTLWKMFGALKL